MWINSKQREEPYLGLTWLDTLPEKAKVARKGETSGNFLKVKEVYKDCDSDTILVKAHPIGPVCHTGAQNCFFQKMK